METTAEITTSTVPSRLREARAAAGLSRAKLGAAVGLDPSRIYQLEHGRGWPLPRNARALAEALGVPVGELFPADEWAARS